MKTLNDGKQSPLFKSIPIKGNTNLEEILKIEMPDLIKGIVRNEMPNGSCVCWGIPFEVGDPLWIKKEPIEVSFSPVKAPWLVFLHTAFPQNRPLNSSGFYQASLGPKELGEHEADYGIVYQDGTEESIMIKMRHQINPPIGQQNLEAVGHVKPKPLPGRGMAQLPFVYWGFAQTLAVNNFDRSILLRSLWAWKNPYPEKEIRMLRIIPAHGDILLFGITAGHVETSPIRWEMRQKALLTLPQGKRFDPSLSDKMDFNLIQLDLGSIISITPQPVYPNDSWPQTYNNQLPQISESKVLVEYTAHPDALFYLPDGNTVSVKELIRKGKTESLQVVPSSRQKINLKVIDKSSRKAVAVKLHIHGENGEYIAPLDRHRYPNPYWFQDYSVDFVHRTNFGFDLNRSPDTSGHACTYISGETTVMVPLGKIYIEISKGFEIRPIRKVIDIDRTTQEIVIELEKVLPWREKGWVTADTHVHFLSPHSALLEGAAEGVNIVNLLASQWGELMTNAGDFDGRTTLGAKEFGGDGEYMVRVGTENRQGVMGHISLLGYKGNIITPLCSGGPNESALGDPVEVLLTEWAAQCKKQGGLVVIPHFQGPRCENAATIVSGNADGVEMTAWGNLYRGIDPYAISDWYRYLNVGCLTAAVAGTDKMSADTAVGTIRTYAHIDPDKDFTYESWMDAVRKAITFVTYGPLMEFTVEGKPAGTWIEMSKSGGTVDVSWKLASVTTPMSKVELVVNGEIRESKTVNPWEDEGHWSVKLEKSSWLALLIRAHYPDKSEIIAAHSSPVMVKVVGTPFMAVADAVTILEQIEGALAYIDTIATRAEDIIYKRMRLILTSAHRDLHNRLHLEGHYHHHTITKDHPEHK